MRKLLTMLTFAGTVLAGSPTIAQDVRVRIGIGDDGPRRMERRIDRDDGVRIERRRVVREIDRDVRPVVTRRVIERRVMTPRRVRTVCRTVVRERVRPNGVIVRRPTEVCRQVVVTR